MKSTCSPALLLAIFGAWAGATSVPGETVPTNAGGPVLTVRTFLVPDGFFAERTGGVKQALAERGIQFPPGATAWMLPSSPKLVVRDTPEQLDRLCDLIKQVSASRAVMPR